MTDLLGKGGESLELLTVDIQCKTRLPPAREVGINPRAECVGAVHVCLPGHGMATRDRPARSTFA
jgi:hypothetical protein